MQYSHVYSESSHRLPCLEPFEKIDWAQVVEFEWKSQKVSEQERIIKLAVGSFIEQWY